MPKPTILILTIQLGAGHRRAASAVARWCEKQIPECEASVLDVTPIFPRWLRWLYVDWYLLLVKHFPGIWRRIERVQRIKTHTLPPWVSQLMGRRIFHLARPWSIATLVSTEVGVNEMAASLKRTCFPAVPLVAVLTDYDVDRAWLQPEVNAFCVGASEVRDEMLALGVPKENVFVTGIPVDDRFVRPPNGPPDPRWKGVSLPRPKILLSGGGEGLLKMDRLLVHLDDMVKTGTATVLVGGNRKLHRQLLDFDQLSRLHLQIEGWTDDMPLLFMSHDLMVAKPGGITMTEAMAAGLPLLASFPLPGSEEKHCRLVEKWQVGLAARTAEEFVVKARRLLEDDRLRRYLAMHATQVYREQHHHSVADVLRRMLRLPMNPAERLRVEFDAWAQAGRGETMADHHRSVAQATLDRMKIRHSDKVLDLGCGVGWASRWMAHLATEGWICGVDISEEMIGRARAHPQNPPHLSFRIADVEELPFPEGQFDKVFSCESFYYYPDLDGALGEVLRVLKPGGAFFCLVNLYKENPYTHVWADLLKVKVHLLSAEEYRRLFQKAGFTKVRAIQIPDRTPIDAAGFKAGWGIETLEDLKEYRDIGALLVMGAKALPPPPGE